MSGATMTAGSDPAVRDGFAQLVRAEWTKFRTVGGWLAGMVVAGVLTVLLGLMTAAGGYTSCRGGPTNCAPPVGPGGEAVVDGFTFVHQPLAGDGSVTVRLTSLAGATSPGGAAEPWAKAGVIVKQSTAQGSTYAAIMMTGGRGVRMQYDYTHDVAGLSGGVSASSPRWLRLTRVGELLTGEESTDGRRWTAVGTVRLAGLGSAVEAGLFVTSPDHEETTQRFGGSSSSGETTQATAQFDHVELGGQWAAAADGEWRSDEVRGAAGGLPSPADGVQRVGDTFTVTGSGDIAPAVPGPGGNTIEQSLGGAFAGLIVLAVVGTLFITAEYRRGLIRTTLAACPRRGQMLAAKAVVLGAITFAVGLAASVLAFQLVKQSRARRGDVVLPVSTLTEWRVVVGTAALLTAAAVLSLAVGTVLRRSAGAVATVIVLLVLPYILAVASVLPASPANWLLRVTPAAAFAIQQSLQRYPQVHTAYVPSTGYFPLAPLAGFAVLGAWTAVALALAAVQLRRRDA